MDTVPSDLVMGAARNAQFNSRPMNTMDPPTRKAVLVTVSDENRFSLHGYEFELSAGDLAHAPADIQQAVKNAASIQAWTVSRDGSDEPQGAIVRAPDLSSRPRG